MEYTDFETGATISRERYIERGLERGELVGKEPCGCVIIQDRTTDAYIVYCPKHKAAPELYEALKSTLDTKITDAVCYALLVEALAKAEGR